MEHGYDRDLELVGAAAAILGARPELADPKGSPMQSRNVDRSRLLIRLNFVERILLAVYQFVLGSLILGIFVGVAAVMHFKPWGAGHQGEWYYFAVAVMLALGCLGARYVAVRRRYRAIGRASQITANGRNFAQGWDVRWHGGEPESTDNNAVEMRFRFSWSPPSLVTEGPEEGSPRDADYGGVEAERLRGVALDDAPAPAASESPYRSTLEPDD